MNNENKKLSQNRKRRFERKIRKDDEVKTLLNKIETEKRKKNNIDKIKNSEILLVKIKYANNPDKFQCALKELNKIQVINENIHKTKNEL